MKVKNETLQFAKKSKMCNLHKSTIFYKKDWTCLKNDSKKLSTFLRQKSPKNRVIHEVFHVIHKKEAFF